MEIINVRIDERLVHGMVATFWIPKLKVNRVICIDNDSANNPAVKSALRMATPQGVSLSVISVEKTIENLKSEKYGPEKIMLVAKDPRVYKQLVDAGIAIKNITMGNLNVIKRPENAISITNFLNITPEEREIFKEFHNRQIGLEIQLIPDETPADFYLAMESKF